MKKEKPIKTIPYKMPNENLFTEKEIRLAFYDKDENGNPYVLEDYIKTFGKKLGQKMYDKTHSWHLTFFSLYL